VTEIVHVPQLKFRGQIPDVHRTNLDTRLAWLWHQRFGTVQTVWQQSKDLLDHTAATLILQAVFGKDLVSINQLFQRLEGGALDDQSLAERLVEEITI
jgi:hypothetical protein